MENELPDPKRPPTEDDLVALCRTLNEADARYLVVGGCAIIFHGFIRATEDIDIVIDGDPENQRRVKAALATLPEQAILELGDDDIRDYIVVRVADEYLVDLMIAACGIEYSEAAQAVETGLISGVPIPFASPQLLLRMKQTHREKDVEDRIFLHRKIAEREGRVPPAGA